VAVTKANLLPMLIVARTAIYTKKNILSAWREVGLIPFNPRQVLDKLTHGQAPIKAFPPAPPSEPPTPRNTAELHRWVRQATLQLKSKQGEVNRVELADLIQQLEKFGIAADKDRELERRTLQQWQEAQKMEAKVDKRELGRSRGRVMDGKTLKQLYLKREALEAKKKKWPQKCSKQPSKPPQSNPPPPASSPENARQFHLLLFVHLMGKRLSVGKSLMGGAVIWKLFLLTRLVLFYLLLR